MNKISLILLLVLLLPSISLVSAAPPVTTIQQFSEGFIIRPPQDNNLKVGQDYEFEFHIFNISNGVPITSGVSCYFHLYDRTGNHIYNKTVLTPADTQFDYSIFVNGSNFTQPDDYFYNMQCNNSLLGGYTENILYVTPMGTANEISKDTSFIMVNAILILMALFFYAVSVLFKHQGTKIFLISLSLITLVLLIGIGASNASSYLGQLGGFSSLYSSYYVLLVILLSAGMIGLIVWLIYYAVNLFGKTRGRIPES